MRSRFRIVSVPRARAHRGPDSPPGVSADGSLRTTGPTNPGRPRSCSTSTAPGSRTTPESEWGETECDGLILDTVPTYSTATTHRRNGCCFLTRQRRSCSWTSSRPSPPPSRRSHVCHASRCPVRREDWAWDSGAAGGSSCVLGASSLTARTSVAGSLWRAGTAHERRTITTAGTVPAHSGGVPSARARCPQRGRGRAVSYARQRSGVSCRPDTASVRDSAHLSVPCTPSHAH